MKTKNKILAIVEIAVVLCSVFLVAIPAIAAEQSVQQEMQKVNISSIITASKDDCVLEIYGNANEDDTIDMGDVVYTKLAIFGKKPKTELCDAKYDGRINVLDVIQTKLIILGKEKELTLIDSPYHGHEQPGRIVTVKKPVQRIVVGWRGILEQLQTVKLEKDRVVGVGSWCQKGAYKIFFPEYQDKPVVSSSDPESILKLDPDLVLLMVGRRGDSTQKVLEAAGITVFRAHGGVWGGDAGKEAIKFGYILDKQDKADEFRNWYESIMNLIKERVEKIPEEDKPKVYFEAWKPYSTGGIDENNIERAGGKDLFGLPGEQGSSIDPEAVVDRNPNVIVRTAGPDVSGYQQDTGDTTKLKEMREEIMSRPELQNVKAVKEGRVYIISTYLTNWGPQAGCRGFLHIVYQAKWFHPDLFEDLDPKAIHQEYLTRFQELDIDLDKQGVFVYPEEPI